MDGTEFMDAEDESTLLSHQFCGHGLAVCPKCDGGLIRSDHDVLLTIQGVLEGILTELHRANSVERTGSVSSVEIKYTAKGEPQPVVKVYAGSVAPVAEAIMAYAETIARAEAAQAVGWAETATMLKQIKEAAA